MSDDQKNLNWRGPTKKFNKMKQNTFKSCNITLLTDTLMLHYQLVKVKIFNNNYQSM